MIGSPTTDMVNRSEVQRIREVIGSSHPLPYWLVLDEFPLDAGNRSRGLPRLDALAIKVLKGGSWCEPDSPIIRHGYEIKISRADFLDELRHPEKRQKAYAVCDYYWFAVPEELVEEHEVPPECGLIWACDGLARATVVKSAARLSTDPPSPHFMMDVARRAYQIGRREGAATCAFERFDMLCNVAQMLIQNRASAAERISSVLALSRALAAMQRHPEARELARIAAGEERSPLWFVNKTLQSGLARANDRRKRR